MTLERIEAVARWGPPINGIWITLAGILYVRPTWIVVLAKCVLHHHQMAKPTPLSLQTVYNLGSSFSHFVRDIGAI
jgi:hypothetical protein